MWQSFVFRPPVDTYRKDIQVWCFKKDTACGLGPLVNIEQASEYKEGEVSKQELFLLHT
jgi:hypothetical protein